MNTAPQPAVTGYDALGDLITRALAAEGPAAAGVPWPYRPATRRERFAAWRRARVSPSRHKAPQ